MQPLNFEGVKRYSLHDRKSKISRKDFGKPIEKGGSFGDFLNSLPHILAGLDFRLIVQALRHARTQKKTILWGIGAHTIKVGLNPIFIDLMKEGYISGILVNGAGVIHDVELALSGKTSEEVSSALQDKNFGVNFDFLQHYRSSLYPVKRAKELGGEGYQMIGHHEILIPLLAAALKEQK